MLLINVAGLVLIAAIIWWFWLYKGPETAISDKAITVVVNNGTYQPSRIKIAANQSATLQFLRKDASPCAEMLLIPDLDISENLPLNKAKIVQLPAMEKGEHNFHCQMQMYRGVLKIEALNAN